MGPGLAIAGPSDEGLHELSCLLIRHRLRRMFHRPRRDGEQRPSQTAVPSHAEAADGVDGHAGAVWGVFNGQADLYLNGAVAKAAPFNP